MRRRPHRAAAVGAGAREKGRGWRAPREAPAAPQEAIAGFPPDLVAKLRDIVRNTEDVGERFPEEARKIHYDEAEKRSIRGKASREEAEALSEEGIDFSQLPSFLTRESH